MHLANTFKILKKNIDNNGSVNIKVDGISMHPTLKKGDIISVISQDKYNVGEIVVYNFNDEGILVHRILKSQKDEYYCKGDNAFRLEHINKKDIIGKVNFINDSIVQIWPQWKIKLSYHINRIYYNSEFDIKFTKNSETFKLYQALVLSGENCDFNLRVTNDLLKYKSRYDKNFDLFENNYLQQLYFEILDMIYQDFSYSKIVLLISSKNSIKICKSKELVNVILTKLVVNDLVLVKI